MKKVNKGLIQFFEKHYKEKYNSLAHWLISIAFHTRLTIIYVKTLLFNDKQPIHKKAKTVVLIGEYDSDIIANQLGKKAERVKVISSFLEHDKMRHEINAVSPNKLIVIFDVSSISYKSALNLMEELKSKKINFHFLLPSENKVIGSSSLIDL